VPAAGTVEIHVPGAIATSGTPDFFPRYGEPVLEIAENDTFRCRLTLTSQNEHLDCHCTAHVSRIEHDLTLL
jgi:hypothetical protein